MFWVMVGCSILYMAFTAHSNYLVCSNNTWLLWKLKLGVHLMCCKLFHCIPYLGAFISGIGFLVRSAFYFAMTKSNLET